MTRRTIFTPRISRCLNLICVFCGCSFFWAAVLQNRAIPGFLAPSRTFVLDDLIFSSDFKQRFTIQTKGCEIPGMTPLNPSIEKYMTLPDVVTCDKPSDTLLDHNRTHIWTKTEIARQYDTITCCYRAFNRSQYVNMASHSVDDRVEYHTCINFTHQITVNDEFVRVICSASVENFPSPTTEIYDQLFLFARPKDFMEHTKKELKNDISSYNVLVMGIDSVSRLNMYRTMPKTVKYLKNNGAIELKGYNKVGDNSYPNLIPMLLGVSVEEMPRTCLPYSRSYFDNCPFVWEWYKQAGYYTALAEDSGWLGTFNYLSSGFVGTPTDYYLHTFFSEVDNLKRNHNIYCVDDRYLFQVLLDFAEDLTTTLKSSRLFGFFWEIVLTHDYLNNAAIMDDGYFNFLNKLEENKYLDETILILVSDHGMRFGGITYTKQGWLESRLPFVFILTPPLFRDNYSEAFNNLKINSKRLTTPFNLHATLNDLANLDNIKNEKILSRSKEEYWNRRSISLFLHIPGNRTCQMAGISDHWCTCHKDVSISLGDVLVTEATKYLIKYMNNLLASQKSCAELSVEKLMQAREMIFLREAEEDEVGWREVRLVVRTRPGEGVFEATLRYYNDGEWALAGQVSRLNLYGNQSQCIDDKLLRLYCYCS